MSDKELPDAIKGDAYWVQCTKCKNTTVPSKDRERAQTTAHGLGWRSVVFPGSLAGRPVCPECLKRPMSDFIWQKADAR